MKLTIFKYIIILSISLVLFGCSLLPESNTPVVTIAPPEKNSIQFTGKGAGAGMMLMSSMGPMGMAVGVAIDVGIGKDIHETAVAGGVDFVEILQSHLQQTLNSAPRHGIISLDIKIEKYGFKTEPGENDPCVVDVELSYSINGGQWQTITSESIYSSSPDLRALIKPFELFKRSPVAIERAFTLFAEDFTIFLLSYR